MIDGENALSRTCKYLRRSTIYFLCFCFVCAHERWCPAFDPIRIWCPILALLCTVVIMYVYGGRESPDSCTRMYVYMTVRKYVLVVSLNLCSDIKTGEEPGFAPYISYRKYSVHPAGWKVLYTQLVIIQVLICTRSAPRTLLPRPIRGRTVRSSRSRCTVRALR